MIKDSVSVQDVCDLFNDIVGKDSQCANALVMSRVPCNEAIAEHPTIQVQADEGGANPRVGLLGFLNGLFGMGDDGMGPICIVLEEDGRVGSMMPIAELPSE